MLALHAPCPSAARLVVGFVAAFTVAVGPLSAREIVARQSADQIQVIVDNLRVRLAIPAEVVVELVAANPRLVSVERIRDRAEAFRLSVENGFLDELTPDERAAVIAHELGHVWIFSNHPYLHTEQLANRIAMRVVSRESLAGAYAKMWARNGTTGDLARFLGDEIHPTVTVAADTTR